MGEEENVSEAMNCDLQKARISRGVKSLLIDLPLILTYESLLSILDSR